MPEKPPSGRPTVSLSGPGGVVRRTAPRRPGEPNYAELLAASNFSFLRGASHPEELAAAAALLDLAGFAIADINTLAGAVRGHLAARQTGARYAVGCRLSFRDGAPDVAAWPGDRAAYGRLCRLLTAGNLRAKKGECHLDLADLLEWGEGLEMAVLPGPRIDAAMRFEGLREGPPPWRGRVPLTLARGAGEGEIEERCTNPLSRPSAKAEGPPLPQGVRAI